MYSTTARFNFLSLSWPYELSRDFMCLSFLHQPQIKSFTNYYWQDLFWGTGIMCAVLIFGYLYINSNMLQKQIFSIFTFEASFVQAVVFYQFTFCHWHPYSKMRVLSTCHQQHKVQGTTIAHYIQHIEQFRKQNSKWYPPPDRLYRHNNTERANGVHILSMYKDFQFTAWSCKNMDRKAVFHVKINPCRFPRSKPSQLTTNWSSFHHSCSIVASYQLG